MSYLDKFDPNEHHRKHPFATYVPSRRGSSFKVHTTRANALAAMQYSRYGMNSILYQWNDGQGWVEVIRFDDEKKPTNCDLCGTNMVEPWPHSKTGTRNTGAQRFLRKPGGKLFDPLTLQTVCKSCRYS